MKNDKPTRGLSQRGRIRILLLSLLLVLNGLPVLHSGADEAGEGTKVKEEETIYIDKAEDLYELSRNAAEEVFTKDKTVVFRADIVVNPYEFAPIPVFCGRIEGNSYTVRGIEIRTEASNTGFIRVLEEGAQIEGLNIEAKILPEGGRSTVGGIVGTNRGSIVSCSFLGEAAGDKDIGGIAAVNEEGASIRGCVNYAQITGNCRVGGIAGLNQGEIIESENRGMVNVKLGEIETGVQDTDIYRFDPRILAIDQFNTDGVNQVLDLKLRDVGGICGMSYGRLEGCSNYAKIGYQDTGNYIGGICGRQNGVIRDCSNHAEVRGKRSVGGIAGQFEPYLVVEYDRDTLDQLDFEMDEISDLQKELKYGFRDSIDRAADHAQRIRELNRELEGIVDLYKEDRRGRRDAFIADFDERSSALQEAIEEVDLRLLSEESKGIVNDMRNEVIDLGLLRNKLSSMEIYGSDKRKLLLEYIALLKEMKNTSAALASDAKSIFIEGTKDAEEGAEDFRNDIDRIEKEAAGLDESIERYRDGLLEDMDRLDEEIGAKSDQISYEIDVLNADLREGRRKNADSADDLGRQINRMRDTLDEGQGRIREKGEEFERGELIRFNDVSELDLPGVEKGIIEDSSNYGRIFAHAKAGGIAGAIGINIEYSGEEIEKEEERSLNIRRNARALIRNSANYEDIDAKEEYAGGIVGKSSVGLLDGNENYGDIYMEEGSYAGGIAGKSMGKIRNSKVMSYIEAKSHAGGIAGFAKELENNKAMASLNPRKGEYLGSIAGELDPEGYALDNLYVKKGMGAIDGITYEGEAVGVEYEEFLSREDVPDRFRSITLSFIADGETIRSVEVEYRGDLSPDQIPEVPQKQGYYAQWEETQYHGIEHNKKIYALYLPMVQTIASSDEALPLLLMEGSFRPKERLRVEETKKRPDMQGFRVLAAYSYKLTQEEQGAKEMEADAETGAVILRVLTKNLGEGIEIGVLDENASLRTIESEQDGLYRVFEAGREGEFFVLQKKKIPYLYPALAGLVLAAALGAYLRKKKHRKNRKQ